jgi:peptidoglycan/LPS O-acetylase OafA/YrhL
MTTRETSERRETAGAAGAAREGGRLSRVYGRLSRVTSSGDFIPEVDGLRFLAIAPVVVYHVRNYLLANPVADYSAPAALDWAARLTHRWGYGVQLFFIISGFVLALPFARARLRLAAPVSLRRYFLRRLTRLEPPYVLVMLGCFALLVLVKGLDAGELWPRLLAGLTYTQGAVYGELNPVNLVAWSLEVEVQFYLLMPLLAAVFAVRGRLRRRGLIVAAASAAVLLQWALIPHGGRLSWSVLNYLQYFFAGFLLADLYLEGPGVRARRSFAWDVAAAAALPLMLLAAERADVARAAFAPLALVVCCAAFRGRVTNFLCTRPWATVVGGMCYTIYLIHTQLISAFEKALGPVAFTRHFSVNLLAHALLLAPVLLLFCAAFFLLVEKPCMRRDWPRRLWRRLRAAAVRRAPAEGLAVGGNLAE